MIKTFTEFIQKYCCKAESLMFVTTLVLLCGIHAYSTYPYKDLEVVTGPPEKIETIEIIVEDTETVLSSEDISDVEENEEVVEKTSDNTYYNVPLDEDLQAYIIDICKDSMVDPEMVMAMIRKESNFNANAIGDSGRSLGLMQIQPKWHQWRMDELFGAGNSDWFDPYKNVAVGVHILNDLYATGLSEEWVLMAYNGGYGYAHKKVAEGIVTEYVVLVRQYINDLERDV